MNEVLEATPGIEPGCTDLQSAASPLRHVASLGGARDPVTRWRLAGVLMVEISGRRGGAMIDFAAARATMVESQLRTDRVTDRRILAAFASLPRELFVPPAKRDLAYSDGALEVWPSLDGGPARYLLQPVVLARLIQLASVEAKDAVLDIGCATGYSTALLAHLARAVTAVEAEPELAAAARETLKALGLSDAA